MRMKAFNGAMSRRTAEVLARFDFESSSNLRTKAMQHRSERILDSFWAAWQRDLGDTDAAQLAAGAELLSKAARGESISRKAAQAVGRSLRMKAYGGNPPAAVAATSQAAAIAALLKQEISAPLKAASDTLYKLTGQG
jgi:hypothetical protein